MLQKKLTDGPYAPLLGKIEAQTDRVGRIIKNLLAFAIRPSNASTSRRAWRRSSPSSITSSGT
jgi:hypothetical protein